MNPGEALSAVDLGLILSLMAIGVFITFRILNLADLTVDGSFTTGASVSAVMCLSSHPFLGLTLSFFVGAAAGCVTAFLYTKLKIQPLLAGIITMTGLYSVNLHIMRAPNINVAATEQNSVYAMAEKLVGTNNSDYAPLIPSAIMVAFVVLLLLLFLKTEIGYALRATGDNPDMVRSQGVNTTFTIFLGYAVSNGAIALSGALFMQKNSFSDISIGVGMIIIGLASVIIGEAIFETIFEKIFKRKPLIVTLTAVIIGSIIYRFIYTIALDINFNPNDIKLLSALIVAFALATPVLSEKIKKIMGKSQKKEMRQ